MTTDPETQVIHPLNNPSPAAHNRRRTLARTILNERRNGQTTKTTRDAISRLIFEIPIDERQRLNAAYIARLRFAGKLPTDVAVSFNLIGDAVREILLNEFLSEYNLKKGRPHNPYATFDS